MRSKPKVKSHFFLNCQLSSVYEDDPFLGPVPSSFIPGVAAGGLEEKAFSISDYRGGFLVLVFYAGDWEPAARDLLASFARSRDKFAAVAGGCQVVACSTDNPKVHRCWIKTDRWVPASMWCR